MSAAQPGGGSTLGADAQMTTTLPTSSTGSSDDQQATTGSANGDEGLPAAEQVAVNVVPLLVGSSTGRCFTSTTNPGSSIVVRGRTYAGGVIQCGGHAPPEQRATGLYGFSQPPSIPKTARIIGFEGRAVVDETSGARPQRSPSRSPMTASPSALPLRARGILSNSAACSTDHAQRISTARVQTSPWTRTPTTSGPG